MLDNFRDETLLPGQYGDVHALRQRFFRQRLFPIHFFADMNQKNLYSAFSNDENFSRILPISSKPAVISARILPFSWGIVVVQSIGITIAQSNTELAISRPHETGVATARFTITKIERQNENLIIKIIAHCSVSNA